nr:reverse transcriptase domain-containing protein [Tanacetum cinerariifolium]
MNKLVRHNLVRGLPTKSFDNDQTCTACLKGKQHKASCKSNLVNSVTKPLHTLDMDLFGPTSVSSISHKWTPQQNGVTERSNRTLIEAARTMLANAKLPVTFWAEAVNTASYVQNKVLVNMSQNKTPYELFNGRTPAIGFLKPFGCHVMILNTLDNLGKFEAKGDEGYFIGYPMSGKAFRVFNKRTRRVEENLHVEFLENKAIEKSTDPNWLFHIDYLTKSMNYVPVDAHEALLESSSSKPHVESSTQVPEGSGNPNPTVSSSNPPTDQMETLTVESPIPTISLPVPTACLNNSPEPSSEARLISKRVANQEETPSLDNILSMTNRFEDILGVTPSLDEAIGVEADVSNMETTISASPTPTLRIHKYHPKSQIIGYVDTPIQARHKSKENKKDERGIVVRNKARLVAQGHTQEEGIDYDDVFVPVARIEAIRLFLAYASFMSFTVYQMDDPTFPAKVYKVEKAMYGLHQAARAWQREDFILVQVYVDDIFGSSNPQLCREFEALMHVNFQMSDMGELNFFLGLQVLQKEDVIFLSQDKYIGDILKKFIFSDVRSSNTLMDKENPWGKDETRKDFWSTARIETTDEGTHILAIVDGIQRTVSESSLRRNLKLRDEDGIVSISDTELFENLTLMRIVPLFDTMLGHHDEPASLVTDVSEGEACPTDSGFIADQDRATIAKSSTLSHDSAPRDTSPAANEGSMQHNISELMALCTSLQRQYSKLQAKFQAQEEEIVKLKERVKVLEDKDDVTVTQSGDDAPIKGRSINEGEAAAKRISIDSEEIARVLTSMDAATVLAGELIEVGPTTSLIVTRRKGKEVMVESDTPKKKKLQEQIDAQVARELEEKQEKENMRINEQIARDAEVVRIHAEEELQRMIDNLDKSNETIAKYLQEYQDFASELPLEKRIELISDLVKYQDNNSKVYKFQSQQRRPMTKKQKREYYMAVIRRNLGWRVKDFKGMSFEEIEAKFAEVWKQVEDFIPMGSKEETERLKRKGLNLEQEQVKKQKSSKEAPEIETFTEDVTEEKIKEMMNEQEHGEHFKLILELLKKEKLYAKFSKCEFWIPRVQFLGHVIDSRGIHVDPAKIESGKDWASPKTPTEICQFLGLAGYYRRFIEGFSKIAKPMTKLTQKKVIFNWGDKQEAAFQLLKQKLCSAPILALPEGAEDFVAYCDASYKDLGAILMCSSVRSEDLEALSVRNEVDYDCEIRYHLGKANVVANALSRKEWIKPLRDAPFEALYGRKCRSPVCWAEVRDAQLIGPEIIQETTEKIVQNKQRLQAACDRQKSYADVRRKPLEFQVGDRVMLKVSPWKGVVRFGKRGKLNPSYIGPFKKCLSDEPLEIPLDELHIDDKLRFVEEPVEIMDREIKRL